MQAGHPFRAWLSRQPEWVFDGGLAVLATVLKLAWLASAPADAAFRATPEGNAAAAALSLLGGLPLVWRRRVPVTVLAVMTLSAVALARLGVPSLGFGLIVALYTVAAYAPRRYSVASLALFTAFAAVALVWAEEVAFAAVNAFVFVTAWVLGDRRRLQRERTAALERRAAELEYQRAARVQLAAAEERERIAAEMHDLLAHSIAAMVTQAAAAERWITVDAGRATQALLGVEETGRQSMAELRRLLGMLRDGGEGRPPAPQPGLDDLPGLLARLRREGLAVRLDVEGRSQPLPTVVELSAYRLVEEALADVRARAGAAAVTVTLRYTPAALTLEVASAVAASIASAAHAGPADAATSGHPAGTTALAGMRERAGLVGGTVDAGPGQDGRFTVRACLPVHGVAR